MDQEAYRKVISGQNGCRCPCVGLGLSFAALVYSLVIRLRNFLYDKGWLKTHRVNAKVLSIGNITVGGTGKTPLVVWLCNTISQKSKRFDMLTVMSNVEGVKNQKCGCAILTRGYKATKNSKLNPQNYLDEPSILAECCPEAKVIVNPDRVAGAKEAITKFGAKVLVMDDGFQHRRLHRDLDIVTIDATLPFGYGRMLPAGLLREPVNSLKRADAVVVTRCDQIREAELSKLEEKLRQVRADMIIARSIHKPVCARAAGGKEISIEQLRGKKVFAFCGIGNPQAFLDTIRRIWAEPVGSKIYDDHHRYTPDDLSYIYEQARTAKAELILTTQKDWSKIIGDFRFEISDLRKSLPSIPLAYLAVELELIRGEDEIMRLIEETLSGKISKKKTPGKTGG